MAPSGGSARRAAHTGRYGQSDSGHPIYREKHTDTHLFSNREENSSFHSSVTWGGSWVGWVNSYFAGRQASQRRASPLISTLCSYSAAGAPQWSDTNSNRHASRTTRCAVIPHTPGATADPGSSNVLGAGSSYSQKLIPCPYCSTKTLFALFHHMPRKSM